VCYISPMANIEPSLFDETDDAAEQRALEEAERAIAEGRTISHAAVRGWLLSWGTQDELPPPKCGA